MTTKEEQGQSKAMKLAVVERYGNLAREASSCCGPTGTKRTHAETLYSEEERAGLPDTALAAAAGCGNPVAMGSIREGQTIVDLGSGGGTDAFMAARMVGSKGKVIGIDMTPDMINLARENAAKLGVENVEFRLAEIEALPVPSSSVDAIISNCVINLAPDKDAVFSEAFRVLKPGGVLHVSDMVLVGEVPEEVKNDTDSWVACLGGAIPQGAYVNKIRQAGFLDVTASGGEPRPDAEGWRKNVASVYVRATKPSPSRCC